MRLSDGMALKETSINRIVETVNGICHSRWVENYLSQLGERVRVSH